MGLLDRLFGNQAAAHAPRGAPASEDQQAIERYRYLLRTAPPETVEQAHAEAFAKLTPEQRRRVLEGLVQAAPPNESAAVAATPVDNPQALARAATRAEYRQPGLMERTLGGGGLGMGASLLSSFMLGFAGSMVANTFFSAMGGFGNDANADAGGDGGGETADAAGDPTDDPGAFDDGGDLDGGDFEV